MRELTTATLIAEMVRALGPRRAASVLGYCSLFAIEGIEGPEGITESKWVRQRTAFRVLADIRQVRAAVVARGYRLPRPEDEEDPQLAGFVRLAA